MSGFARKAVWADPRTPNVVAINAWKAKECQATQVRTSCLKIRRGRNFVNDWMLDMRGHKPQKTDTSNQGFQKNSLKKGNTQELKGNNQQEENGKNNDESPPADHPTNNQHDRPHKRKEQENDKDKDDEAIDPHIPLPKIKRWQKAQSFEEHQEEMKSAAKTIEDYRNSEPTGEGNRSSSSGTAGKSQSEDTTKGCQKRKAEDQLVDLRNDNKEGKIKDQKKNQEEGSGEVRKQNSKRKAETQLEDERGRGQQPLRAVKIDSEQEGVCVHGVRKDPKEPQKKIALKEGSKTEFRGSHEGAQSMAENRHLSEGRQGTTPGKGANRSSRARVHYTAEAVKKNLRDNTCRASCKNDRCFHCNSRPAKGEEFNVCPNGLAWIGFKPGKKGCSSCIRHLMKTEASYLKEKGLESTHS